MQVYCRSAWTQGFSYYRNLNLGSSNSFCAKDLKNSINGAEVNKIDTKKVQFGVAHTNSMLTIEFAEGKWGIPQIKPFGPFQLHPFSSGLHYAIQCFEGMKAYRNGKGEVRLFRPECNMYRLKQTSARIALPDFDGAELLGCIKELVRFERDSIPAESQCSLYIRPLHLSTEETLGVKPPGQSLLSVTSSPVGAYFSSGFKPVAMLCSDKFIRSAPGGMGNYKAGLNYAPTLVPCRTATEKGYQQLLWLYDDKIVEVGTCNIFFVFEINGKKTVVTPALEDLILPGVTRDSILTLLRDSPGLTVE